MSRVRILTVTDVALVSSWLAAYTGPLGIALDATGRACSITGTSGEAFTFPTECTAVITAVFAALTADGRRAWADQGTGTAKMVAHRSGLPVEQFATVSCVQTLRAVLLPGSEAPRRPTAAYASAGSVAREVSALHAAHPKEDRRLALESVRQDVLWRRRQMDGVTLDMELLPRETHRVWGEKRDLASANAIDLTGDGADVLAWVASHGITILDEKGEPTLSKDFFDSAVIPEASLPAWKTFRAARSLKSVMEKLMELTRAERGGRVYPEVVIRHAVTGRGTIRRPGLQNISGKLRPLLTTAPGMVLVSLDLNRCEVTLAAAMSGCPDLAAALSAGDPYVALVVAEHGAEAAGDVALRTMYKRALIAALYGQGPVSLGIALGITTERAKELKSGLKKAWPRVFDWISENTRAAKAGGVGRTMTGRATPALTAESSFKRTNHVVQGSGADYLYRGVERVAEQLGAAVLYLTVHDEVVLEVRPEAAQEASRVLVECMTFDLPGGLRLTGEATVLGTSWGK